MHKGMLIIDSDSIITVSYEFLSGFNQIHIDVKVMRSA